MAQQHNPEATTPTPESDSVFFARCYLREKLAASRLLTMACGHNVSKPNRLALNVGVTALDMQALESLRYAHKSGGLLFCWQGSALEGGAA